MNKDIKARWVAALRSSKYRQTRLRLHRVTPESPEVLGQRPSAPAGFCCLGVLCDLAVQEGVLQLGDVEKDGAQVYADVTLSGDLFLHQTSVLPRSVVAWAGLSEPNPLVRSTRSDADSLASCNDSGTSFAEIADLIEDQL